LQERTAKAIVDFALREAGSVAKARLAGKGGSSSSSSGSGSGGSDSKPSKKSSTGGTGSGGGSHSDSSAPGGGKNVITLTDDNFEDLVINSNDAWFVEFYVSSMLSRN
jgi:hypothetical protein